MISFKVLTDKNKEEVATSLSSALASESAEYLREIILGIDTACEDAEYAVALFGDTLLLRIFDMGRYLFVYPCELCEGADVIGAIDEVRRYATLEEIPLTFVDVPREALGSFAGYRHMDIDAEDSECLTYRVRIKNECELSTEIPKARWGRVELNEICEADIPLYAELSKDENVNKYWGYNYSDDVKNPPDEYFYENAKSEFIKGVAISMAVRVSGEFVGEVTLYAFDCKGGAEFAIRLLARYQGLGLGNEAVSALKLASAKIGLVRLYSRVMTENSRSLSMLGKVSQKETVSGGCVCFTIDL